SQELMDVQAEINVQINEEIIGNVVECVLDYELEDSPGVFIGRTWMDAPDVDGVVYVTYPQEDAEGPKKRPLKEGQFLNVNIIDQEEYDLIGIPD
ncbi:MAG: hypothetical protein IKS45_08370, partial [Thermoguttaceae bacterium]|nr:hypothetical protein [Thermoguttaceae bacterium]